MTSWPVQDPGATRPATETEAAVRGYLDRLRWLGIYLTDPAAEPELVANVVELVATVGESAPGLADDALLRWSVLAELGRDTGWSAHELPCSTVWHLDLECIEDEDSYPNIIRRLGHMTSGALDVRDVRFEAEPDGTGTIWLTLAGEAHSFTVADSDDWFDPDVLVWINDLLVRSGSHQIFHGLPTGGQDALLLFADQHTYDALLDELPKVDEWFSGSRHGRVLAGLSGKPPSLAVWLVLALVWVGVGALVVATFQTKGFLLGLGSAVTGLTGAAVISGIILAKNEDAHSSRRFRRLVWGAVLVGLLIAAMLVVGYGGRLPYLDQVPKHKTVAYLDQHLPVAATYVGEGAASTDGNRQYLFIDADGLEFRCTASYRTGTGLLLFANPNLWCTWPVTYARQHDDQLVEALSAWAYDPERAIITLWDVDDVDDLSHALAAQLEVIRAPVLDDPDRVFWPFSFEVWWAPQGRAPVLLDYFDQPVGDTSSLTAEEISERLLSAIEQADD